MYGHIEKKIRYLDIGTTNDVVLMQAYGLIMHMVFGEVPLSYRIKDPGTDGTASKYFFFGKDCRAFDAPQTR